MNKKGEVHQNAVSAALHLKVTEEYVRTKIIYSFVDDIVLAWFVKTDLHRNELHAGAALRHTGRGSRSGASSCRLDRED